MLDAPVRRLLDPALRRAAAALDVAWVTPDRLSLAGMAGGLGSAAAAAGQLWALALVLWLVSRAFDGLDGPLARRRAAAAGREPTGAGGFLDITADFVAYGATVVGVAVGTTAAYDGSWLPFLLVLFAYYINGATFLAFSSIAERTGRRLDDGRSLSFLGGLAEGTETILVHAVWLLFPAYAGLVASGWAVVVGVSAAQRAVGGYRALR